MSDATEQFRQTFLEEGLEGLDVMESGLLALRSGSIDLEAVNSIFRAAHSIKGGAGAVGFPGVSNFMHSVETLLDELRRGERVAEPESIDLLLRAVDCVRVMLETGPNSLETAGAGGAEITRQLRATLARPGSAAGADAQPAGRPVPEAVQCWRIGFRPHAELFHSGNDPVRLFRELASLGALRVRCDASGLPALADLVPQDCYLAWELELATAVPEAKVREVFAWVEGECDLRLEPMTPAAPAAVAASPCLTAATCATAMPRPPAGATEPEAAARAMGAERRSGADRRAGSERRGQSPAAEASSLRVATDKIDALVNMVGELVITQSMLGQIGAAFDLTRLHALGQGLVQLERNTRELQEAVMRIRMLPIGFVFNRIPRIVHDLSAKLGKRIDLVTTGERTELDKTVLEKLGDPLVHIVRNALDHGIETPDERRAAGKPEAGRLHVSACHQGGNVIIEITDDGRGLDRERILEKARAHGLVAPDELPPDDKLFALIFHAGLSTARAVTEVSGRGVGMDVVRRNIKELGGSVAVASTPGQGVKVQIRLPLTLAILDGQLMRVGKETYITPLVSIVESVQARPEQISTMAGKAELFRLRDEYLPIVRLHDLFGVEPDAERLESGLLVVVEGDGQRAALFVDELLAQQQIVIKSLETNYRRVSGVSGATILGDGTVAMILDIAGLIDTGARRLQRTSRDTAHACAEGVLS